ncbi:MAG: glutamate 5-kinase [Reyranellaceae bacterium]
MAGRRRVTALAVNRLVGARRLVVKIGSSILVDEARGEVRHDWLEALADDVARLHRGVDGRAGCEVVLVSSGAIRLGRASLGLANGALRLEESQAAAATGQIRLAHAYQAALARHDITVAQVLLTLDDSEERRRYLNARQTMATLLGLKAVPVINENDTVATDEIRFGDNDRLGARVAEMISADTLVLLSDIDGFYTGDPRSDPDAVLIPEIREITPAIEAMAGGAASELSNGGMTTKLIAGRIAMAAGCRMAIADGRPVGALGRLIDGSARCTWFVPEGSPLSARKKWIKGSLKTAGTLTVDDGAVRALASGKSLLPAGVTGIDGEFRRGDVVDVKDRTGRMLARGLVAYAADEARRIAGRKSAEIERLLGFRGRDEMVHRDDLVVE